MSIPSHDVVAVLLARQIISRTQLAEAERVAAQTGAKLLDVLLKLGHVTPDELLTATAIAYGMPTINLTGVTIPAAVIELVPESVARENVVLPLAIENGMLRIAIADPSDFETLQKLRFILNKDLQPVLALKEQIVEAINRHYGGVETESVDSRLSEFTDTQIDFTETDADEDEEIRVTRSARARNEDEEIVDSGTESDRMKPKRAAGPFVNRHATVRYYDRMNPQRMFPLLVVLSRRAIEEVVKRGVDEAHSKVFQVAAGSLVEVEPILPGCACYPPKEQVRIGKGEVSTTFRVVPQVLGNLQQARVVVRQDGAVLAEVPLEACVVRQHLTVLMGMMSLLLPFFLMVLRHYRLDFESQLQDGFDVYVHGMQAVLQWVSPGLLFGVGCALTTVAYLWLRPRQRDVFWDITSIGPETKDESDVPASPSEDATPVASATLAEADRHYQAQNYTAALPLYARALGLDGPSAGHYVRAAMAAHHTGDTARALAILRRAAAILPSAEARGALWYNMGCFAARLGQFDEALGYLHRAVDAGYRDAEKYRSDPDLERLRWQAGFKRLLAGLERPAELAHP